METGIYSDIENEDYHRGPGISKSGLDLIARSPLHYWAAYLDPNREPRAATPAQALGTAIHTLILEPETYSDRYVVMPEGIDRRTTAGRTEYARLMAEADEKGATLISLNDHERALRVAHSAAMHPVAGQIFADGRAEQSVFWTDAETGVLCKCRPDWLLGGENPAILDVKSALDASPDGFMRSAYRYRYHVQAAWYFDGIEAATGQRPDSFMFCAVETAAPFAAAYYYADDVMLEAGRMEYRRALNTYAECVERGEWPGYSDRLMPLSLPRWAQPQIEIEEMEVAYV